MRDALANATDVADRHPDDPIARNVAIIYPGSPHEQRKKAIEFMAAIHIYSQEAIPHEYSIYFIINQLMNSAERPRIIHWRDYVYPLGHALMMLPPLPRCTLFRGVPRALPRALVEGNTVMWYGVTSMSSAIAAMTQFLSESGPNTIFHVTTQHARDITRYSGCDDEEREAVLPIQMSLVVRKADFIASANTTEVHLEDSPAGSPIPRIGSPQPPIPGIAEDRLAAEIERVRKAAEEAEAGHAAEAATLRARIAELERQAAFATAASSPFAAASSSSGPMLPAFAAAAAAAQSTSSSASTSAPSVATTAAAAVASPPGPAMLLHAFSGPSRAAIAPQELTHFLKLVCEGEQIQAEALLRAKSELVLVPGNITDLSGRIFNNITGFQYAVWALDWRMWCMMWKYLGANDNARIRETRKQLFGDTSWQSQYGADDGQLINNFIDALNAYIKFDQRKESDSAPRIEYWRINVVGANQQLPIHVVNEYCQPGRRDPYKPNFSDPTPLVSTTMSGSWWIIREGSSMGRWGSILGRANHPAYCPAAYEPGNHLTHGPAPYLCMLPDDVRFIHALLATRIEQRDKLLAELRADIALGVVELPAAPITPAFASAASASRDGRLSDTPSPLPSGTSPPRPSGAPPRVGMLPAFPPSRLAFSPSTLEVYHRIEPESDKKKKWFQKCVMM
jgi:hypothetical protein